ncbi:SDR family NAD(P)-dependent oxidoreductase [Carboxylicivirga sp. A043]|uniref:oxidoreductase n=1 Tax=Carboxylicivirga litoralis TaxID=2816963 RepID=UPI0021CB5A4C|nr:oxidoreductase [Carboxylicivirga sp. A043]MCU4156852.1 SDR family NAD(P)-dependent oxidoreductase [Carboxylicivirga sp. A043]
MATTQWNESNIPDQTGKVVIITGATSGLGKQAAKVLTAKNAKVIMAVRNMEKGHNVLRELTKGYPNHTTSVMKVDLSSLQSIEKFAAAFKAQYNQLDVLINNAGIMACPFATTEDGFEIQMGTNHLGHFALVGHLMDVLKSTPGSRLVVTSSIAHKMTKGIEFNDINWEKRKYKTNTAYADSKLANVYFAYELVNRYKTDPEAPRVTIAHPGWTSTDLQRHMGLARLLNPIFSQQADMGVLPTLRAAFDETARNKDFFGPKGALEFKGYPVKVNANKLAQLEEPARKLWDISEQLTGVKY